MSAVEEIIVKCPQCQKRGKWLAHAWAPFCSERCKLLDLGQWFTEEHKISRELRPNDFEHLEDLPPGVDPDAL